jgi:hypothetical protein
MHLHSPTLRTLLITSVLLLGGLALLLALSPAS